MVSWTLTDFATQNEARADLLTRLELDRLGRVTSSARPTAPPGISVGCATMEASYVQKSSIPPTVVHTDIPFRLDRLPLSRFHVLVVVGLGITWILDGLEVTIVGSLGPALQSAQTLHLSSANLGAVASFYIVGAVTGALGFGWITDRFGRRLGCRRGVGRN